MAATQCMLEHYTGQVVRLKKVNKIRLIIGFLLLVDPISWGALAKEIIAYVLLSLDYKAVRALSS